MGIKETTHDYNIFSRDRVCCNFNILTHMENEPTPIFCDNNSTIALSKNHIFHKNRKQIETEFHFIRELFNNGDIFLQFLDQEIN